MDKKVLVFASQENSLLEADGLILARPMCRYGQSTYKEPFACFDCRKSFKQTSRWELPNHLRVAPGEERVVLCPQCRKPMADMGHDFKPPRTDDLQQWKNVQLLFEAGFSYHSCGSCGPGYRPSDLKEVTAFIESQRDPSEGELLLKRIKDRQTAGVKG